MPASVSCPWVAMSLVPNQSWDAEAGGDALGVALEIAWIAAEIAFNVFGMFF